MPLSKQINLEVVKIATADCDDIQVAVLKFWVEFKKHKTANY